MGRIYQNAREVIIWLGESNFEADAAVSFLQDLYYLIYGPGAHSAWIKQQDLRIRALNRLSNPLVVKYLEPDCAESWVYICQLLERDWWNRAWVVQEFINAQKPVFQIGEHILSWTMLFEVVVFIQSAIKKWSALATDLEFAAGALIDAYDLMYDKYDQTRMKEEQRGINIQSLLAAQRHRKCLREVDKFFSIQSLTRQNVQRLLTLDYSKPVEWTFSMAVKAYAETSEDIEILCEAMSHDPARPYPSWCPDWTVPRTRSQLGGYPYESGYRASGQVVAKVSFSKDLRTITLSGIIFVDTIKDTQVQQTAEEFKWEHCESGSKCNWNPVTTADDLAILKERLSTSNLGIRSGSLETTYRGVTCHYGCGPYFY